MLLGKEMGFILHQQTHTLEWKRGEKQTEQTLRGHHKV